MPPRRKPSSRALTLVAKPTATLDMTPESRRVLKAAALDVARELGRQAAKEHFEMAIRKSSKAS